MNPLIIPLAELAIELGKSIYDMATAPAQEAAAIAAWASERVAELRAMRGTSQESHDARTAATQAVIDASTAK